MHMVNFDIDKACGKIKIMHAVNNGPIDMLMYYDARPSEFNGLFDFYTLRPIKGYYPIKMFSRLYELGSQVECECREKDVYAVGAKNDNGEAAFMIARYEDNDDITEEKTVTVNIPA